MSKFVFFPFSSHKFRGAWQRSSVERCLFYPSDKLPDIQFRRLSRSNFGWLNWMGRQMNRNIMKFCSLMHHIIWNSSFDSSPMTNHMLWLYFRYFEWHSCRHFWYAIQIHGIMYPFSFIPITYLYYWCVSLHFPMDIWQILLWFGHQSK